MNNKSDETFANGELDASNSEASVKNNNNRVPKMIRKFERICVPISEMLEKVSKEPKQKMLYSGIKENSFGFIFGPSKSGKTTFCENLGMRIAAGYDDFLGLPISTENRKVLFISLEEFYQGRSGRNKSQVERIINERGDKALNSYYVANENVPRYVITDEDWQQIYDEIDYYKPGIVFIDSLTRLCEDNIEESVVAKNITRKLRELTIKLNTTIVIIHHTPKLGNAPLTINSMAGSRVLPQEADFMFGLNKTFDGKIYLKEVAFRYAPENSEQVTLLKLDNEQWMSSIGKADEIQLLSFLDGRTDDTNRKALMDFILSNANENGVVETSAIENKFVNSQKMSRATMFNGLKALMDGGSIQKAEKGQYKLAA